LKLWKKDLIAVSIEGMQRGFQKKGFDAALLVLLDEDFEATAIYGNAT